MDGIIETDLGPIGENPDGTFQVGTKARLVPLANGFAIEIQDANGNWIRQTTWQQT
jgi:hypothetical protein